MQCPVFKPVLLVFATCVFCRSPSHSVQIWLHKRRPAGLAGPRGGPSSPLTFGGWGVDEQAFHLLKLGEEAASYLVPWERPPVKPSLMRGSLSHGPFLHTQSCRPSVGSSASLSLLFHPGSIADVIIYKENCSHVTCSGTLLRLRVSQEEVCASTGPGPSPPSHLQRPPRQPSGPS